MTHEFGTIFIIIAFIAIFGAFFFIVRMYLDMKDKMLVQHNLTFFKNSCASIKPSLVILEDKIAVALLKFDTIVDSYSNYKPKHIDSIRKEVLYSAGVVPNSYLQFSTLDIALVSLESADLSFFESDVFEPSSELSTILQDLHSELHENLELKIERLNSVFIELSGEKSLANSEYQNVELYRSYVALLSNIDSLKTFQSTEFCFEKDSILTDIIYYSSVLLFLRDSLAIQNSFIESFTFDIL